MVMMMKSLKKDMDFQWMGYYESRVSYERLKEIDMDKINQIQKEIFRSMKMMDTTIKGIKESEEYKIAQAYNQGLRDAMAIFKREMKR